MPWPSHGAPDAASADALFRLATDIASHESLEPLLDAVAARLAEITPFDAVGVLLHDPVRQVLSLRMVMAEHRAVPEPLREYLGTITEVPVDYGPAGWVWLEQAPRVDRLAAGETHLHPTFTALARSGFRTVHWLPLSTPRARLGTLAIARYDADDGDGDVGALASQAASLIALAIEHALHVQSLARLQGELQAQRDQAHQVLAELSERVKELRVVHQASRLLDRADLATRALLEALVALLPAAFQVPHLATCRIRVGQETVQAADWTETPWMITTDFGGAEVGGSLAVAYRSVPPTLGEAAIFLPEERHLLQTVADMVASTLARRRAQDQAERYHRDLVVKRDRLQLMLDLHNALVGDSDGSPLAALERLRRDLPHDFASVVVAGGAAGEALTEIVRTHHDARGLLEPQGAPIPAAAPPARAIVTRQAQTSTVIGQADPWSAALRGVGIDGVCSVPLIGPRGVVGALTLGRRNDRPFTEDEAALLGEVAGQLAIGVANRLAYQEISSLKDRLAEEKQYLEDEVAKRLDVSRIVGTSEAMRRLLDQVRTVAPTDATVLLLGETGTGKELLARALHDLSRRRDRTFVRVNSASLPQGLVESELFGHEKGAFTGAVAAKVGRLEIAHRGSLFLDEVGDLPLDVQPKLLRALQEREFERVGGTRTIAVDVRLIAATHRPLSDMVATGEFRSDLFYRLNVFPLVVPPLRERRDDIPLLVEHFLRTFGREMRRGVLRVPAASMDVLRAWHWPGNIRELQNVIERAVILSPGPDLVLPADVLREVAAPVPTGDQAAAAVPGSRSLASQERDAILSALRDAGGRIGGPHGAAARLGLRRTTLHSRMQKLGIRRPTF
ncbi:hypothetical protein TBR22_A17850 [Luteitalea sp. TBR-22]|uniref:sigma 54-interacting transcriptional regulator n=1 Tax=Luteitalea sp. TBR-22 TaxID=2802971 RepID=UPI001AF8B98E|nr:sigma 54-interacting transcriptional regulator [Luteitalea sp. TBR-22]BCS32571.1 hypothetical protein TBR22_A17850 [Luteitalea sp. TBR-22]